jgi:uncharacterized glyoxalase superfamily protein PhnB
LLAKHLDGYTWHGASELAESNRASIETPKDHRLPSALNHLERGIEWAAAAFHIASARLVHENLLLAGPRVLESALLRTSPGAINVPNMPSARLFRVILPVSQIDMAAAYYGAVLGAPGSRISPGRHYFGCGEVILACFDPQADGDPWEAKPNPEHLYFLVDHLEEYFRRVQAQPNSRISRPIETQPWGERSFYCLDPFGNKLCFVQSETAFTGGLI